jgi:peptidoglycan-N-acetylglucosamine deacetylase
MLYRLTNILFFSLFWILNSINIFTLSNSIDFYLPITYQWYILLFVLYLAILIIGAAYINSQFYLPVICKGSANTKKIAISFDDSPHSEYTKKVLDLLQAHNIKATFFCTGKNIDKSPEILKQIHQQGHTIGNHSFSHSIIFDFFPLKKMLKDLQKTHQLVFDSTGKKMRFFRPPYGVTNPAVKKSLKKMNYLAIGWNVRSFDTSTKHAEKIYNRVTKNLKAGDIVLFHDNHKNIQTVLEKFLHFAKENKFQLVTIDNLIQKDAYQNP